MKPIAITSDHAGFKLKELIKKELTSRGVAHEDFGTDSESTSVDYPRMGDQLGQKVASGEYERGIAVCGTGIGISIAANRHNGARAALCTTPEMASLSRQHNNSNILALGGRTTDPEEAKNILGAWLDTEFEGGRHQRRVGQLTNAPATRILPEADPEVYASVDREEKRQANQLEMIASENFVSQAVKEATGSVLTNKYAEGYPGKRWYGGCSNVDEVENLAVERAKRLFGAKHVNVQPHSGSQANMAVFHALLKPGDTVMGLGTGQGGHLTHGSLDNFSGQMYKSISYSVDESSLLINYDAVRELARKHKPQVIIVGASAYPRTLHFDKFREIADQVGAKLMADIAHTAGLVAAGLHPSPINHAHVVTTTTHKTLRGPRGGMIMTNDPAMAELLDKSVFPGIQGGPLMHVVAAKAVAFKEALDPSFKTYQAQTIQNAATLAQTLIDEGFVLVTGGTDTHMLIVDLRPLNISGKDAEKALEASGIAANTTSIPFDPTPGRGIRFGTPALTTRGMKEEEMRQVGKMIAETLKNCNDNNSHQRVRTQATALCNQYPLW